MGYAEAFGLPAALLILAIVIFWLGKDKYRTHAPQGSTLKDSALVYTSLLVSFHLSFTVLPPLSSFLSSPPHLTTSLRFSGTHSPPTSNTAAVVYPNTNRSSTSQKIVTPRTSSQMSNRLSPCYWFSSLFPSSGLSSINTPRAGSSRLRQ